MNLPVIVVRSVFHGKQFCVGLMFKYNFELKNLIKSGGYSWSGAKSMWYRPAAEGVIEDLMQLVAGRAKLDLTAMESDENPFISGRDKRLPVDQKRALTTYYHGVLDTEQQKWIADFRKRLRAGRYAKQTERTYGDIMATFLGFTGWKGPQDINEKDIWAFAADYLNRHGYSDVYHRQFKGALKLFLNTNQVKLDVNELIQMPRRGKKLPKVLSMQDVYQMIRLTTNLKHRVIISVLYGCGLRVGELRALRISNLRLDRNIIEIRGAKGHKDRVVGMSGLLSKLVRNYLESYEPKHFFIQGGKGEAYSATSVRSVVSQAAERAKLKVHVHPHMLRHSYATHLLEEGVDLRFLQELLGHSKPETTMGYTYVAQRQLTEIENPFDRMLRKHNENNDGNNYLTDNDPG